LFSSVSSSNILYICTCICNIISREKGVNDVRLKEPAGDGSAEVELVIKADTGIPFDVKRMPPGFFLDTVDWKEGTLTFIAWTCAIRHYVNCCREAEERKSL